MNEIKVGDVVGRGLAFPIELQNGKAVITNGIPLIHSSLKNIMCWLTSTRYFLGEYGSDLLKFMGEPNDKVLQALVEHRLVESCANWENRIEILDVQVRRDNLDATVIITMHYRIINARIDDTFIYPFNANEINT